MATVYELVVEELDTDGDILECHYVDSVEEACGIISSIGCEYQVGICRRSGNDDEGETVREYAYIEDGEVPVAFENGSKLPKKYQVMLAKLI